MRSETFIVLSDYDSLIAAYQDEQSRIRWGVVCNPVEIINGKWCLPLGWESELDADGIEYTIETLQWEEETL